MKQKKERKEIVIPKGIILLGSSFTIGEANYSTFRWFYNQHEYIMDETPVTEAEYDGKGQSKLPKTEVTLLDCVRMANRRSEEDGLEPVYEIKDDDLIINEEANGWRLPTAALHEFAAKGASMDYFTYAGSDNIDEVAWYSSNSGGKKQEVALKKPNQLGLFDMSGNVWEWTETEYSASTLEEVVQGNTFVLNNEFIHEDARQHLLAAFKKAEFIISGQKVTSAFFMGYLKTRFGTLKRIEFEIRENNLLPALFTSLIEDYFDQIPAFTAKGAFQENNLELRRIMLSCLPTEEVFRDIDMKKISSKVMKHPNHTWEVDQEGNIINVVVDENFETLFELYSADAEKLGFKEAREPRIAILKCWCPTTDREYLLKVHPQFLKGDPLDAVAWTFPCPYDKIRGILRQGDVCVYLPAEGAVDLVEHRVVSGKEYEKYLYAES